MLGLSEAPWAQRALDDSAKGKLAQAKAKADNEAKRKKDAPPTHKLSDYAGQFEHPAYQTLTISQEGEQLKMDLHGLTGALKHYHYDIFQAGEGGPMEGTKITFIVNAAGEIEGVSIPLEPSVKEIVFKRKAKADERASAQK
jgi:hypothetical protein